MLLLCVFTQFCNTLRLLALMLGLFLWIINLHLIKLFQLNSLLNQSNWGFISPLLFGFWIFFLVFFVESITSSKNQQEYFEPQNSKCGRLHKAVYCHQYYMYTNDCVSHSVSVKICKFADDTTIIGLITDTNEADYRNQVSALIEWSYTHHLKLKVKKLRKL